MDEGLMKLLCYEALNSARDFPRHRKILDDDAKTIRLGVAKVLAVYAFFVDKTEAPVPELGAALFKTYAGQARHFLSRAIGTTEADEILRSRADLVLVTAAEEVDEHLGAEKEEVGYGLSHGAALVEALCEARYALDQAFQRGPGWEELARAVSGRIASELEVHGRG